jgi:hypothetical protein
MADSKDKSAMELLKEVERMETELKEAEEKIPVLKKQISGNLAQAKTLIKSRRGSTGNSIMDHIVVRYGRIDLGLGKLLEEWKEKCEVMEGELLLVMKITRVLQFFLGVIRQGSFSFSSDSMDIFFPTAKFVYWKEGCKQKLTQGILGKGTHPEFELDLQELTDDINDEDHTNMVMLGDGEVWKFFKAVGVDAKNEMRAALKILDVRDTYQW